MIPSIAADVAKAPALFRWRGAIESDRLTGWLQERGYLLPVELVDLWEETGGGTLFETEDVLEPLGPSPDTVDARSGSWHDQGLPTTIVLFHEGAWLTGVEQPTQRLVTFDPRTMRQLHHWTDLDAWYQGLLRAEYAGRYGLT